MFLQKIQRPLSHVGPVAEGMPTTIGSKQLFEFLRAHVIQLPHEIGALLRRMDSSSEAMT
jgi:hypothetical protein